MNQVQNYDMKASRVKLINLLAKSLNKSSKWYAEDYENIVSSVNRKTRKELLESLERQRAISQVSESEIKRNCQF